MCHKVSLKAGRHQALGLLWDYYQRIKTRGKKGGNSGKSSSPDHHITGWLFSFLVTDCKRAFCVTSQRLQDLCYSVMLIILKLPRSSWHENAIRGAGGNNISINC